MKYNGVARVAGRLVGLVWTVSAYIVPFMWR